MEEIKNFDAFYETKLQSYLDDLREQNRIADYWGIAALLAGLSIIPVLVFGLSDSSGSFGGWLIFIMVVLLITSVYQYTSVNDAYETNFKEKIVRQIIEFLHPGLIYKPDICISSVNYKRSGLFRAYYDDYDGDDLIEGIYKNVSFKCSELSVTKRSNFTIFKGLFFLAHINPRFTGGTYIWFKGFEQLPASIADERYRLMPMPYVKKVDCRNGDFEKCYSVYTTDVYEASELVSPAMMSLIMSFMRQINRGIEISFVAGLCYVAIPFAENLFEPQSGDPADKTEIRNYFFTVLLILSVINQLKLEELQ